jgi:hypothetical protein
MKTDPHAEHRWLKRLVGTWRMTMAECAAEMPGGDGGQAGPADNEWIETVRELGDLFVVSEGRGTMPDDGARAETLMVLGYDPRKARYVGSWSGSMMDVFWVYEGTLDASGDVLTLDTTGPDFNAPDTLLPYQDIYTFESPTRRALTSRMKGADGEWVQVMSATYERID